MRAVPLTKLLRVTTRNIGYKPHETGGGEDWLTLLRRYWDQQVESNIAGFTFQRRRNRLLSEAKTFYQSEVFSSMRYYTNEFYRDGGGVRYELSCAFVSAFVTQVFQIEMARTLKVFLSEGEFYKPQNRRDFAESIEGLQSSREAFAEFDADLSGDGAVGKRITAAREAGRGESDRREKVAGILSRSDDIALGLCSTARTHLLLLISVVKGLLYGESGGKYDTLSNISYIGGFENERLRARLKQILKRAENGSRLMGEIIELEQSVVT
jgi:hypothetical protein